MIAVNVPKILYTNYAPTWAWPAEKDIPINLKTDPEKFTSQYSHSNLRINGNAAQLLVEDRTSKELVFVTCGSVNHSIAPGSPCLADGASARQFVCRLKPAYSNQTRLLWIATGSRISDQASLFHYEHKFDLRAPECLAYVVPDHRLCPRSQECSAHEF